VAPSRPVGGSVSADWQQGNVDFVTVARFPEAGKISTVARNEKWCARHRDDEAAKGAMQIGQKIARPSDGKV